MAKKKKHRKTRKQKMSSSNAASSTQQTPEAIKAIKPIQKPKEVVANPAPQSSQEDHEYVKSDATRSMVLLGIILLAFGVLYVVLNNTSLGTQVYSIIKL